MATSTPWGPSQGSNKIATGIMFYHTARHGGVHLSPKRNAQVPDYMRAADGWYEEDCEWAIAAVVFMDEFLDDALQHENMTSDKFRDIVMIPSRIGIPMNMKSFTTLRCVKVIHSSAMRPYSGNTPKTSM